MKKSVWYWILGILLATAVAAAVWAMAQPTPTVPGGEDSGHAGHSAGSSGEVSASQDTDLAAYLAEQDDIMDAMMRGMMAVEPSGNAAIDFLEGMIPHHEAAIAMAESYLGNNGSHVQLSRLADVIVTDQAAEIQQMNDILHTLREQGAQDEAEEAAYLEAYDAMMDRHHTSHVSERTMDAAFAEGMILHHQMAVDMANAILAHTEEEDVITLAQAMADAQTREIAKMQEILQALRS